MSRALPKEAVDKLAALANAADEAEALAIVCQNKLGGLQKQIGLVKDYEMASDLQREIDRLMETKAGHQKRFRSLAALVASVNHWLEGTPTGSVFEPRNAQTVKLLKGESLPDGVLRIRAEIADATHELRRVRLASPPLADRKAKLREAVANLAEKGRPKLSFARSTVSIDFRDPNSFTPGTPPERVAAILAWFDQDALLSRLSDELEKLPKPELSLSEADKAQRIDDITASVTRLELIEEAMISKAHEQGQVIDRRETASPAIILGVTVKARARAA